MSFPTLLLRDAARISHCVSTYNKNEQEKERSGGGGGGGQEIYRFKWRNITTVRRLRNTTCGIKDNKNTFCGLYWAPPTPCFQRILSLVQDLCTQLFHIATTQNNEASQQTNQPKKKKNHPWKKQTRKPKTDIKSVPVLP